VIGWFHENALFNSLHWNGRADLKEQVISRQNINLGLTPAPKHYLIHCKNIETHMLWVSIFLTMAQCRVKWTKVGQTSSGPLMKVYNKVFLVPKLSVLTKFCLVSFCLWPKCFASRKYHSYLLTSTTKVEWFFRKIKWPWDHFGLNRIGQLLILIFPLFSLKAQGLPTDILGWKILPGTNTQAY